MITDYQNAQVGTTVVFGTYEQRNVPNREKESIEWLVLEKRENQILVISKFALDCQPYHISKTDVTWEACSLRPWLNGMFYNSAFTEEEKSMIADTAVSADKNPAYDTATGNETTDKVFLLSITEAETYFSSDEDRKCVPTEYAIAQGAYPSYGFLGDGKPTCSWWLRTPGRYQDCIALSIDDGTVNSYGRVANNHSDCIRPALWLRLKA